MWTFQLIERVEFHLDLLSNKEVVLNGGKVPRVLFGNFTKFLVSKHVFFVIYYTRNSRIWLQIINSKLSLAF